MEKISKNWIIAAMGVKFVELDYRPLWKITGMGGESFMKYVPFNGSTLLAFQSYNPEKNEHLVRTPGLIDTNFFDFITRLNEYVKISKDIDNISNASKEEKQIMKKCENERISYEMENNIPCAEIVDYSNYIPKYFFVSPIEKIEEMGEVASILGMYHFFGRLEFIPNPLNLLKKYEDSQKNKDSSGYI